MPAPLLAGDVIPASAETSYTPALDATTTDPTLGSGSVQLGRYYVDPITGWIRGQLVIVFGTSGTNAGSGNYLVSLPTAIDEMASSTTLGVADIIGWGIVRDSSSAVTGPRLVVGFRASSTGGTGGVGQILMAICDGTNDIVAHAEPFAWAASDAISLQFAYPGA